MDAVFPAATVGAKLLMNALEYGKHTANHWTQGIKNPHTKLKKIYL